jgi:patatin-like phospholipase/acyl hydrolase
MTDNTQLCGHEPNFHALALTGGGFRGLFTARVLQRIEEHMQMPIGRQFDLIAGTSIGGIIALAIGFEVPMEKVVTVFKNNGLHIFPPIRRAPKNRLLQFADLLAHLFVPRYFSGPLSSAVEELIPQNTLLGSSSHALVIPSVNVTKGTLRVFKTPHHANFYEDASRTVTEVALATSAAPTYFDLAKSGNDLFADGGIFANAPDLVAAHESDYVFNVHPKNFRLLSIGTLSSEFSIPDTNRREFGVFDWMKNGRLLETMISAQGQFTTQIMKHRYGNNYVRLDSLVANSERKLELDNASKEMADYLITEADRVANIALNSSLSAFMNHKPKTWKTNGQS